MSGSFAMSSCHSLAAFCWRQTTLSCRPYFTIQRHNADRRISDPHEVLELKEIKVSRGRPG
jgi:hypothetical protein